MTSSVKIPILLLKTRSIPHDSYEEYFSSPTSPFAPAFVPVLEHRPNIQNLNHVRQLLLEKEFGAREDARYGGMIFTSQRAVEGFARVVSEITPAEAGMDVRADESTMNNTLSNPDAASPTIFPLYTVGPATSRTLQTLLTSPRKGLTRLLSPSQPAILGAETGNGEMLAHYILEHYNGLPQNKANTGDRTASKRPLLFLVGEQRRDVIPNTLMSETLEDERRIQVDELVVYETVVMESFPSDFVAQRDACQKNPNVTVVVVVVFSPSGCEAMLSALDLLDPKTRRATSRAQQSCQSQNDKADADKPGRKTWIMATIGPTTRDYLSKEFGFVVDVCAEKPSPEGVGEGVVAFLKEKGILRAWV